MNIQTKPTYLHRVRRVILAILIAGLPIYLLFSQSDSLDSHAYATNHVSESLSIAQTEDAINQTPDWFLGGTRGSAAIAWGDFDNDGDLDLASATENVANVLYENIDGRLSEQPVWQSAIAVDSTAVAWGDIDNDGDLDLIFGNDNSYLHLNNDGQIDPHHSYRLAGNSISTILFGDLNDDDYPELIIGYRLNGADEIYFNNNGQFDDEPTWTSTLDRTTGDLKLGDMDNDGDLDLVAGMLNHRDVIYWNENGSINPEPFEIFPFGNINKTTDSIALGDFDNDGDLDIAAGTNTSSSEPQQDVIYTNLGNNEFSLTWLSDLAIHTGSVAWADIDSDGDLDLAADNTIYLNQNGIIETTPSWSATEGQDIDIIAFGDVNGDGRLDLAMGGFAFDNVYIHLNQIPILQREPIWSSPEASKTHCVALGDADGNGTLDLVAVNSGGLVQLYLNDGSAQFNTDDWLYNDGYETLDVAWADVDKDGDQDLVTGNDRGPNQLYENVDGIVQTPPIWTSVDTDETRAIALADYNDDGYPDLAVGNDNGVNKIYVNHGNPPDDIFSTEPAWVSREDDDTYALTWADIDNDGDPDLTEGNGNRGIRTYINMDGQLTPDIWQPADGELLEVGAWGDMNGDQLPDLAVADEGEPVHIYLNLGNGTLDTQAVWRSAETDQTYAVAWGDVDGDADLDLAVGNSRGPDKLYLNVNGMLQVTAIWTSTERNATRGLAWGDMDGDGDLDLALVNETGVSGDLDGLDKVYRNDNGMLTNKAVWSSPEARHSTSVAWTDVDQDGDNDLVIGREHESTVLFLSDGTSLETTPSWISGEQVHTKDVAWGYLNEDEYPDLAVANIEDTVNHVYLNNGDGTFPITATWQTNEQESSTSLEWADFDSDGDDDLLVGNLRNSASRVYLNQGGALTPALWSLGSAERTEHITWLDVDNDTDLDIVALSYDGLIVYHNQRNNPTVNQKLSHGNLFSGVEGFIEVSYRINALAWGDVDKDSDLDLAVAGDGQVLLYLNDGGFLQATHSWSTSDTNDPMSLGWGDMNKDGHLDLAVGNDRLPDRVYINHKGRLEVNASWNSEHLYQTSSVAWADVNQSGFPDLAVGSEDEDEPVHIYLNINGMLEATHSWRSTAVENETYDIAWGDVNKDGYPDLAVANDSRPDSSSSSPNRVYLNQKGMVNSVADWESLDNYHATCAAWGDVDGDYDLDLAIAFDEGPNKIYYNIDGTLQRDAPWSSVEQDESDDIAWGDMDGDGDLDLAVANDNAPDRVYRNVDGRLKESADWSSQDDRDSYSVAWGDVDDDGDLDLAIGMRAGGNRVYLNLGNTLEEQASWESDDDENTYSIAWGDINGDGRLDLAVGNANTPNKVYFNQGRMLQKVAEWKSEDGDVTSSVVLKDMDNDGDLDLVAGNIGNPNKIYFNINGELEPTASWTSAAEDATSHIAIGDVDNDGDNDLVAGNLDEPNTIHLNPLRQGSLQHDIPIYVAVSRPTATHNADFFSTAEIISGDIITIPYTLFASEHVTATWVLPQFSLDNGGTWQTATRYEPATATHSQGLSASPTGIEHVFVWNIKADGVIKHDAVTFRIRVADQDTHSPIIWPAQDGKTLPFRVEAPWYIKVIGEENIFLENIEVYANGQEIGIPNRAGLLGVDDPIAISTPLVAFATQYTQPTTRTHHDNWAYRIVDINRVWDDTDFTIPDRATESGQQTLTIQDEGPLVLFNLIISIEWNANDEYFAELEQAMKSASDYLYDVTNGQMAFEQVTIYDAGQNWNSADIRIAAQNIVRPHAYIGGILSDNPTHVVHLGRQWNGETSNEGKWSDPNGYRTITHEFLHYALHLFDEYFGFKYENSEIVGELVAFCVGPQVQRNDKDTTNASIMDYQYKSSELSAMDVDGAWSRLCERTAQYQMHHGSAWDTLTQIYTDTQTPPRWTFITPMSLGKIVTGPTSLPDDFPAWPTVHISNNVGSPNLMELTVWNAEGTAYSGVNVTLQKTNRDIIEQGFTDENGELMIYGAEIGDELRLAVFQEGVAARIEIIDTLPISVSLSGL